MTFDEYSQQAIGFATYPNRGQNITYPALNLAGEVGEFTSILAKGLRRASDAYDTAQGTNLWDHLTEDKQNKALDELGDILWELNACILEAGFTLEEVAARNIEKLTARHA